MNPVYGEEMEPAWRNHDSSERISWEPRAPDVPAPPRFAQNAPAIDPDWDDSHWNLGEHYWLGRRYHKHGLWHSFANFFRRPVKPDWLVRDETLEALKHDPLVNPSGILVTVKRGVVTLSGKVDNEWMKRQAEDTVYFLPGVEEVVNNLTLTCH